MNSFASASIQNLLTGQVSSMSCVCVEVFDWCQKINLKCTKFIEFCVLWPSVTMVSHGNRQVLWIICSVNIGNKKLSTITWCVVHQMSYVFPIRYASSSAGGERVSVVRSSHVGGLCFNQSLFCTGLSFVVINYTPAASMI